MVKYVGQLFGVKFDHQFDQYSYRKPPKSFKAPSFPHAISSPSTEYPTTAPEASTADVSERAFCRQFRGADQYPYLHSQNNIRCQPS